ncbi:hypothetical protein PSTT_02745 [Puccinia striiformis]|uniref:GAG-pre-integrase domain-containing protein n=1 Tax=Puccinia striiformis TaxID=27350 RepID=A0A2S4VYG8_9BASI|nr:hypothetical protein PSTT_02745 [Puccinia striiformis]
MSNQPSMDAIKWHERLGHANDKAVKKFLERFVSVEAARNWQPFLCEQCVQSKITGRRFLPPSSVPKTELLDLLVSDVMGPFDKDIHGFHLPSRYGTTRRYSTRALSQVPQMRQWRRVHFKEAAGPPQSSGHHHSPFVLHTTLKKTARLNGSTEL